MKVRSSKRAKACDIPPRVKRIVWDRDEGLCIFCHRPGAPNMHYIPRSRGGLGIPENIGTGCYKCHNAYDNTEKRQEMKLIFQSYLQDQYPDFDEKKLIYRKYEE